MSDAIGYPLFCNWRLFVKTLFRVLDQWMWAGSVASMFLLVGVVLLQVFARVALPQVPAWTEEASRFFFMWAVGFAAGPAVREQAYVDVDSFTIHMPAKLQLGLAVVIDAILTVFTAIMAYESGKLVLAVEGQTSAALIWPMWVFYASIWLQTTMLSLYLARSVVRMLHTGSIKNEEQGIKGGEAL
jgi:TRAP-type C4-dicarboxylate transport system permease small subunit